MTQIPANAAAKNPVATVNSVAIWTRSPFCKLNPMYIAPITAASTAAICSDCVFERRKWSGIVATASSPPMAAAGDGASEFVMRPRITRFVLQSHTPKRFSCDHSKEYFLL